MAAKRTGRVKRVECKRCGKSTPQSIATANQGHCRSCATSDEVVTRNQMIGSAISAALFLVGGVIVFFYFRHVEAEGGRVRMNALTALAYHLLGPFGTLIAALFLSAASAWVAWTKRKQLQALELLELMGE